MNSTVSGYKIPFKDKPFQIKDAASLKYSERNDFDDMKIAVNDLLHKKVMKRCSEKKINFCHRVFW